MILSPFLSPLRHLSEPSILCTFLILISSVAAQLETTSSRNPQLRQRDLTLSDLPTNITTAPNNFPNCIEQARDPRVPPKFFPAKVPDCAIILYRILSSSQATIPMPWHDVTPQSASFIRRWVFGTCSLVLRAVSPDSRDVFAEITVARQAALIMSSCLTPTTGYLGGHMLVGSRSAYRVVIAGQAVPVRQDA